MAVNRRKPETRHERAIVALLTASSMAEAAAAAHISETTLYRWLREPAFTDKYREARRQAVLHAIARLSAACAIAVDVLTKIMQDSDSPTSSRVTAARSVLELAIRGEHAAAEGLESDSTDVVITIGGQELSRTSIEAKLARLKDTREPEVSDYTPAELQGLKAIYEAAAARRGRNGDH